MIKTGLKLAGPIIRGLKGIGARVKKKVAAGKAWVKGKVEAGKEYVKGKAEAGKQWVKGKADSVRGPRAARDERLDRQPQERWPRRESRPRPTSVHVRDGS